LLTVDDNADDKDDDDLSRNNGYILEVLGCDIIRCRWWFTRFWNALCILCSVYTHPWLFSEDGTSAFSTTLL